METSHALHRLFKNKAKKSKVKDLLWKPHMLIR